jgi:hypothetical protein
MLFVRVYSMCTHILFVGLLFLVPVPCACAIMSAEAVCESEVDTRTVQIVDSL